jgi:hypothetical protein
MPSEVNAPVVAVPADRLNLTQGAVRGSKAEVAGVGSYGAACTCPCFADDDA